VSSATRDDVDRQVGGHGNRDPFPIQRPEIACEPVEVVTVKDPDQAYDGEGVAQRLRQPRGNFASRLRQDRRSQDS